MSPSRLSKLIRVGRVRLRRPDFRQAAAMSASGAWCQTLTQGRVLSPGEAKENWIRGPGGLPAAGRRPDSAWMAGSPPGGFPTACSNTEASKVYGGCGYGQTAWSLRTDERSGS